MSLSVTHAFVSTIPDDPSSAAAGDVVPSNWNAAHTISGTLPAANVGPAGSAGQIQFNNAGALGAFASYTASTSTLQFDAADAAAPNAQTLQVQSVVAGTSNTAGQDFTIKGSKGTGSGAGGNILLQVAPAGSSGTSQNANALTTVVGSNLVEQRNGTNAQTMRVYRTVDSYPTTTNYERALFDWNANSGILTLGTDASGTGLGRHVFINAASTANQTASKVFINTGFLNSQAALNVTISNASPAVIAPSVGLEGFFNGQPILLSTTGTLPSPLATLTTYYVTGSILTQFNVSTTYNGSNVNTTTNGSGTHTATPGGVVTITNASPAVVTLNHHGYVPGQIVQFQTTGSLPTGLSTGTNYYITFDPTQVTPNISVNTFQVSTTLGGAAINTSSAGSGTHTVQLQATATTQNPLSSVVTFGPSALTGGQSAPCYLGTQFWNTSANTPGPVGISFDVIDINSDISSKLIDCQVNHVSNFSVYKSGITLMAGVTVANLPAASATYQGARGTVTDATQALTAGIGAIVAGGSNNVVPVFCDGTNWRIG